LTDHTRPPRTPTAGVVGDLRQVGATPEPDAERLIGSIVPEKQYLRPPSA
jgi:hypothetical protein